MRIPTVHIVGAGHGDASLITVRGMRLLAMADVIVHDHLVPARLLDAAAQRAERIDVGAAAPQALAQDAICLLLTEKAREGRSVVRLKWGDPFFFDSGGREALFLHEHGIPFEVVPGVPATITAACYAGIPITYPDGGDTVTFLRGFEDQSSAGPNVSWEALARLDGTVVCYAGARQIPVVIASLLEHGRRPDEPAAVVYDGALPQQRTLEASLGSLAALVESSGGRSPGMLIVGPVVGLRAHLRWFDARPLFGRRIVVTRARDQAGEIIERLEELGAQVVLSSPVRILPPDDETALDEACSHAAMYDWVVFTSANGVRFFLEHFLAGQGDIRELKGPRLCTVGPATAESLRRFGLRVDVVPAEHRADAIVEALGAVAPVAGARVLLPRSDIAREGLPEALRKAGARVDEVTAYRTAQDPSWRGGESDVYKMLLDAKVDAVMFTSASGVRAFARGLGEDQAVDLLRTTAVASIGPVTAEAAQQLGIETTVMPTDYTVPALIEALIAHFSAGRDLPEPAAPQTP